MAINIDKNVENKKESLLTPGEEAAELLLKNKNLEKQEEKQEEKPKWFEKKDALGWRDGPRSDEWFKANNINKEEFLKVEEDYLVSQFGSDGYFMIKDIEENQHDMGFIPNYFKMREKRNQILEDYQAKKSNQGINKLLNPDKEQRDIEPQSFVAASFDKKKQLTPLEKKIAINMGIYTEEEIENLDGNSTKEQMAVNPVIIDPIDSFWEKANDRVEEKLDSWKKNYLPDYVVNEDGELIGDNISDIFNEGADGSVVKLMELWGNPDLTTKEKQDILHRQLTDEDKDLGAIGRLIKTSGMLYYDLAPFLSAMFAQPSFKKIIKKKHLAAAISIGTAVTAVETIRNMYIEAILSDTPPKDFETWWQLFIEEGAALRSLKQGAKAGLTMSGFAYGGPKAIQLGQKYLPKNALTNSALATIGLGTIGNVGGWTTMHTLIEGEMPTKKDLLDIALLAGAFNVAGPSTNLFVKRVVHLSQDTNKTIKQTIQDVKNNPSKHGFLFDFKNRGEWLPTLNTKKRIETVELKIESLKEVINDPKKIPKSIEPMQKQLIALREDLKKLRKNITATNFKVDNEKGIKLTEKIKNLKLKIKDQENINRAPEQFKQAYELYAKLTGRNPKEQDIDMLKRTYEKDQSKKQEEFIDSHGNPKKVTDLIRYENKFSTSFKNLPKNVKDATTAFFTMTLDGMHKLRLLDIKYDKYGKQIYHGNSVYEFFRLQKGMGTRALHFIFENTLNYKTLSPNGKSLVNVFVDNAIKTKQHIIDFTNYVVALRALERKAEGKESGLTSKLEYVRDLEKIIKDAPENFKKANKELQEWNTRLLTYLKESGLISQQYFDILKTKTYISFGRIKEQKTPTGKKSLKSKPLKAVKEYVEGKIDPIDSPFETMVFNTMNLIILAEGNRARTMFYDHVKAEPKLFPDIERVKNIKKINEIIKEENKKLTIKEGDLQITEFGNDIKSYHNTLKYQKDSTHVSYMKKGKFETWNIKDKDLANIVNQTIENGHTKFIWDVLAAPTKLIRAGSILNTAFMLKNLFRDTFFAPLVSKNWFIPIYSSVKGMYKYTRGRYPMFAHSKYVKQWKQFQVSGGMQGMFKDIDRIILKKGEFTDAVLKENRKGITARNVIDFINPKNWLENLRLLGEMFEVGTRLENYHLTQKRLVKWNKKASKKYPEKMLTKKEIIEMAGFEARDITIDFSRVGTKTGIINKIAAFWNPTYQGFWKAWENIIWAKKKNYGAVAPLEKLIKMGMLTITLPALLEWWTHKDDPTWRSYSKIAHQMNNIVVIPMGEKEIVQHIPRGHSVGYIFGYMITEMFDQMYLRHLARLPEKERPEAWQNQNITKNMKKTLKLYVNAEIEEDYLYNIVADYMQQNVVPFVKFGTPDVVRVPIQDAYNRDFFRDIRILNKEQEDLPNIFQRSEWTSPTAIFIAEQMDHYIYHGASNVDAHWAGINLNSPQKVDMWIDGYTSTLGRIFVNYLTDPIATYFDPGREEYIHPESKDWIKNLHNQPIISALIKRNHSKSTLYLNKFWDKYSEYRQYEKLFRKSTDIEVLKDKALHKDFQRWSKKHNNISLEEGKAIFEVLDNMRRVIATLNQNITLMTKLDEDGQFNKDLIKDGEDKEQAEDFLFQKIQENYIAMNNAAGATLDILAVREKKRITKIKEREEFKKRYKQINEGIKTN